MRKPNRTFLATLIIAFAGITTAGAQTVSEMNKTLDDLFGAHAPYVKFFDTLKKAAAADDKQAVASMVDYPFQARINDKAMKIRDEKHFVADYDKIVTRKVKNAIAKQTYPNLFANWQGVMIGDGEVWFSGIGDSDTVRITAIND
ncbi:hypothetical protein [Aquamicrobium sp. LC103]|uniref:hypothetical protein n=1 Tax=Aquamicrobium sp. LC103 TaxID=1120658 RepID=UPI00063E85F4|nr:hypothetical protein [Aquamicrobium sp. LC103]TKT78337.1 hypothetical protein XW59_012005 [Aquamicrobium sp. LC103]